VIIDLINGTPFGELGVVWLNMDIVTPLHRPAFEVQKQRADEVHIAFHERTPQTFRQSARRSMPKPHIEGFRIRISPAFEAAGES
jgi:hypothetical protein